MSGEKCSFCGKDWVRASTSSDSATLRRAGGDSVVAGMVGFMEGLQDGMGPLEQCGGCGKTVCRTCAKGAASQAGRSGYTCPGCSTSLG